MGSPGCHDTGWLTLSIGIAAHAIGALLLLNVTTGPSLATDTDGSVHRVLVIYDGYDSMPANIEVGRGIAARLAAAAPVHCEIYSEFLDLDRLPGPLNEERVASFLKSKYTGLGMDVVLAAGPGSLGFATRHLKEFAPGASIVFGGVTARSVGSSDLPADARGVVSRFDLGKTIDLARQLQTDASRIVIFTGSSDLDRSWQASARQVVPDHSGGLEVEFVTDRTVEEFIELAKGLDRRTILVVLTVSEDADGTKFIPRDLAAEIAAASSAPTYGVYSTFISAGIMAGYVETFQSIGEAMGDLALAAAADADGPKIIEPRAHPLVNWPQIRRFGIDASYLPPDAERLFYKPSVWEEYKLEIMVIAMVISMQGALIVALVIQERRRRYMAAQLIDQRLELAHFSRTAQLGQLSGAFAHELNQPLASILANAEAGMQLMRRDPPDIGQIAEILSDIADDDQRAAGIIAQLRQLMSRGDATFDDIDLNEVVAKTLALARSELLVRQTGVERWHGQPQIPVRGNALQLQQVVLNLVLNAVEAMVEVPPQQRVVRLETYVRDDGWRELSVTDRGPGVSGELMKDAFKQFVTTKENGLGFGLSICQLIAQAHGGRLAFDEKASRGARIILTLPPP